MPNTAPGFVLDLTPTTYLDSRGIHLILDLAERGRRGQQQMRLVVPDTSHVRRILLLSHVQDAVPLDATVADAVSVIRTTQPGLDR